MSELAKRQWVYVMRPCDYGIPGCRCGNDDCPYSEFVDRLWCERCQKDFEPAHWGIFDGPIMWNISQMLGYCFDRIDLTRGVLQVAILRDHEIDYVDNRGLLLCDKSA